MSLSPKATRLRPGEADLGGETLKAFLRCGLRLQRKRSPRKGRPPLTERPSAVPRHGRFRDPTGTETVAVSHVAGLQDQKITRRRRRWTSPRQRMRHPVSCANCALKSGRIHGVHLCSPADEQHGTALCCLQPGPAEAHFNHVQP